MASLERRAGSFLHRSYGFLLARLASYLNPTYLDAFSPFSPTDSGGSLVDDAGNSGCVGGRAWCVCGCLMG